MKVTVVPIITHQVHGTCVPSHKYNSTPNPHATHTHCPRCGTPTVTVAAGHAQRCPADGSEHFPRIDPAVIMLVTDPDDRCLLARNRRWPERRVSILAGFVE